MSYYKGASIFKNAEKHVSARWLVKIDLKDFFHSISERRVYNLVKSYGYPPLLSFEIARLATRPYSKIYGIQKKVKSRKRLKYKFYSSMELSVLPQGGNLSPALSNLVLKSFDDQIEAVASKFDCTCTRYADDIVFSTLSKSFNRQKATELVGKIYDVINRNGFNPNKKKTRIIPPGSRKLVTGLVVNDSEPKLPKEFKENIDKHLYFIKKYGVLGHVKRRKFYTVGTFQSHLKGLIRFASSVEEDFGKDRLAVFNSIDWESANELEYGKIPFWVD